MIYTHALCKLCCVYFKRCCCPTEISQESGITTDDLISTLQYYGLLKYWKGKHIIIKKKVAWWASLFVWVSCDHPFVCMICLPALLTTALTHFCLLGLNSQTPFCLCVASQDLLEDHSKKMDERKKSPRSVDVSCLAWSPSVYPEYPP